MKTPQRFIKKVFACISIGTRADKIILCFYANVKGFVCILIAQICTSGKYCISVHMFIKSITTMQNHQQQISIFLDILWEVLHQYIFFFFFCLTYRILGKGIKSKSYLNGHILKYKASEKAVVFDKFGVKMCF